MCEGPKGGEEIKAGHHALTSGRGAAGAMVLSGLLLQPGMATVKRGSALAISIEHASHLLTNKLKWHRADCILSTPLKTPWQHADVDANSTSYLPCCL